MGQDNYTDNCGRFIKVRTGGANIPKVLTLETFEFYWKWRKYVLRAVRRASDLV